jgi:hypothetical protein
LQASDNGDTPSREDALAVCAFLFYGCGDDSALDPGEPPSGFPFGFGLGTKRDIKQIESVAREHGMTPEQRREFGDYVESYKDSNNLPKGSTLSYSELQRLAREFIGK